MNKSELLPLLPEIKEIIQLAFPDNEIFGMLRTTPDGTFALVFYDDKEKALSCKGMDGSKVALVEGKDGIWSATHYGIFNYGIQENMEVTYGFVPIPKISNDPVKLAEIVVDYLGGID